MPEMSDLCYLRKPRWSLFVPENREYASGRMTVSSFTLNLDHKLFQDLNWLRINLDVVWLWFRISKRPLKTTERHLCNFSHWVFSVWRRWWELLFLSSTKFTEELLSFRIWLVEIIHTYWKSMWLELDWCIFQWMLLQIITETGEEGVLHCKVSIVYL